MEDDFVLTISDNDDTQSTSSEDASRNRGQKRKRESRGTGSKKRQKSLKEAQEPESGDDLSEEEEEQGTIDGAINPDFEFDLGIDAVGIDEVEEFDGWGHGSTDDAVKGNKKAVDIDQIIAKRLAKQKENPHSTREIDDSGSDAESDALSAIDAEGEDPDFPEFDDELLAEDTFGGQVGSESEGEESEVGSDATSLDSDSDSDSVASPTAHPDDLASSHSDDDQDEVSSQSSAPDDDEEAAKRAAFFAPERGPKETQTLQTSFQQFSLSRPILRALTTLSYSTPTPIQSRTIPVALQGLDIVGSAVTGSGKTAAFLLPILERLLYRPRKIPITRVVILMPTRELAVQCHNVATALARYTDISFAQVVGGFSLREQEAVLRTRPDVVIATPGRFIDHMRNSASFAVESIEILVLDEADRMLEDGFADELDEILKTIPKGRQTMLFSATMTETVDKLVRVGMNRPIRISVDAKRSTVSGLVQEFVRLRPGREQMRLATLALLCSNVFTERTIVFFRQKKEAHRVRIVFGLLGIKAGELHGSMSQEQRMAAVNAFRDGKTTHLLATDLASRGLDIKNVMSVINYEAPQSHEIYLHRVGRTARAGRSGRACTIAAEPDRKVVKAAVKAARSQGAKIASRTTEAKEVDAMHQQIEAFADDIEEILQEEKEEKVLSQTEKQITRGENLVKHQDEIMSRPKRTWFESEKEKKVAKERGKAELNSGVKFTGEKKSLSNKAKKKLDDRRQRTEGRLWKKGKGDAESLAQKSSDRKKEKAASKKSSKKTSNKKGKPRR